MGLFGFSPWKHEYLAWSRSTSMMAHAESTSVCANFDFGRSDIHVFGVKFQISHIFLCLGGSPFLIVMITIELAWLVVNDYSTTGMNSEAFRWSSRAGIGTREPTACMGKAKAQKVELWLYMYVVVKLYDRKSISGTCQTLPLICLLQRHPFYLQSLKLNRSHNGTSNQHVLLLEIQSRGERWILYS